MRIGRQRVPLVTPPAHTTPQSLVAAAAQIHLEGQAWRTWKFGDDSWQTEAWRLYDIIGELNFVANWIGSACSRVRIYVAEVDDNGRIQQETKKKAVAGLADTLFGGPSAKSEALRMMAINLTVAGDVYVVGRGTDDPTTDDWMVVSCSELKRWGPGGSNISWVYGDDRKEKELLDLKRDLIIRIWTPHPRRNLWADSPTRAAMPMLWEIERLTRYVFAQIDSRLVSAGLMPIPKEVSFPDEDPELSGADQLASRLMRTGSASLKGEGTAAGVVPTFVEMPLEALGKIELIQFASELSKQALDLRAEALRRFALAMNIDPSILSGAGEANHWGAWQIMEGQVKVHIEPLMTRICDGLTTAYLQPALKSLKLDPEKYIFWYDTAPLTVRPERLKDTREMYDAGLVGAAAVLLSGDYAISDAPSVEEDLRRFTRDLMLRDANLFQIPAVRKVAGYTDEILPPGEVTNPAAQPGMPGAGPPPPPTPPTGISATPGGPMPVDSVAQNALPGPGGAAGVPAGTPAGVTASAGVAGDMNTFLVANATVLRAMERAGKRLISRRTAGRFPDTPPHELHTQLPTDGQSPLSLLDGAWDQMSVLTEAVDPNMDVLALQEALTTYCVGLITHRKPHQVELLATWLRQKGLLDGQP